MIRNVIIILGINIILSPLRLTPGRYDAIMSMYIKYNHTSPMALKCLTSETMPICRKYYVETKTSLVTKILLGSGVGVGIGIFIASDISSSSRLVWEFLIQADIFHSFTNSSMGPRSFIFFQTELHSTKARSTVLRRSSLYVSNTVLNGADRWRVNTREKRMASSRA